MLKKNPPQWTLRQTKAVKEESYRHMQLMSVGELSYVFKITIIKDTCVDIKVARVKHPSSITTLRSKKSLQSNEALRSSKWKFTVKHIKGTENVLADFLAWPKAYKSEENYPKDASRVQKHTPNFLSMVLSVASHNEERSFSTLTPPRALFFFTIGNVETIEGLIFDMFHPDYPFLNIFHIHDLWRFLKEALCFFYYLFEIFTVGISFNVEKLLSYVVKSHFKDVPPTLNIYLLCYNGLSHITNGQDVETSDDDDDARSLWSSNDDEHFNSFEDDPTHPDAPTHTYARWMSIEEGLYLAIVCALGTVGPGIMPLAPNSTGYSGAMAQAIAPKSDVTSAKTSELGPVSSRLLLLEFLEMVVGNYRFVVEKDWYVTFVVEVGIVERAIGDRD
ncbi:hypothetical protein Tco_0954626 [Tanacetum coccineum]|uniref:Uncharacterized protein n=1 Tax=Tanacetum coccineum TaxID=301880 RepID=A0ABQ5E4X5_9ASTR